MCGICGYYNTDKGLTVDEGVLQKMLSLVKHRGPDECGTYKNEHIALGHNRLSIIDLKRGRQPISNEDGSAWLICNGEIFNYIELRKELKAKGHRFKTSSDNEVILHLYEEDGPSSLHKLNGQFAFAIWDGKAEKLFMARDRFGIEPLFYTKTKSSLLFASEIKAILSYPGMSPILDIKSIDQIFTFWTTVPPKTAFKNIFELSPGHYLMCKKGKMELKRYWSLTFPLRGDYEERPQEYYTERLKELLIDAVRIRLRADVPVGAYMSGGIDSSIVASLLRRETGARSSTFSIRFSDRRYDEGPYQDAMTKYLNINNADTKCTNKDIINIFPRVVWHSEIPILRTAPVPLYMLSRLAKERGFKVVLNGDGADEFLLGYDIYKEARIRRFWSRQPLSRKRPLLLKNLYPYLPFVREGDIGYLKKFFGKGLSDTRNIYYSHLLRWETTSRIKNYFSNDVKSELADYDSLDELKKTLDPDFVKWDYMARAQYLETVLFLSNYLLSSQGDRPLMANGVEARIPYLDHRLVEFANKIPPRMKMRALNEKYVLKKSMADYVPEAIVNRKKQPYRAPNIDLSSEGKGLDYIYELLSPKNIRETGLFNPEKVKMLVDKLKKGRTGLYSEVDSMAFNGILSSQLVYEMFIKDFKCLKMK